MIKFSNYDYIERYLNGLIVLRQEAAENRNINLRTTTIYHLITDHFIIA